MSSLQPSSSSRQVPLAAESSLEIQSGRMTHHQPSGQVNKGGGRRGIVKGMSEASRRRLMAKTASLDWETLVSKNVPIWFVTLTVPQHLWHLRRECYFALDCFRRKLDREHGDEKGYLGAIVRVELGSLHGALHYHLLVIGGNNLAQENPDQVRLGVELPGWCARTWSTALGVGAVRVHVEKAVSAEDVNRYMVKYCCKAAYEGAERDAPRENRACVELSRGVDGNAPLSKAHNAKQGHTGHRWWYVWGAEKLPWGEEFVYEGNFAAAMAKRLKRCFRRLYVEIERRRQARQVLGAEVWRATKRIPRFIQEWSVSHLTKPRCEGARARRRHKLEDAQAAGEGFELVRQALPLTYAEKLRRSSGGCTILLSPPLMKRLSIQAENHAEWEQLPGEVRQAVLLELPIAERRILFADVGYFPSLESPCLP